MPIQRKSNLFAFGGKFLVVCPQCSQRAVLARNVGASPGDVAVSCAQCEFGQQWQNADVKLESSWHWFGDQTDSARMAMPVPPGYRGNPVNLWVETSPEPTVQSVGLKLKLWLQTLCQAENLWFLGDEHLVFVRDYLDSPVENHPLYLATATYGEKVRWIQPWMERAENRDAILESVRKLRRELGTPF